MITSDPPGAECEVRQGSMPVGYIKSTPGRVHVDKESDDLRITCTKDQFSDGTAIDSSGFEPWFLGNLIFGGIIGIVIDAATGALHSYDEEVYVQLKPMADTTINPPTQQPQPYQAPGVMASAPGPYQTPNPQPTSYQATAPYPAPYQQAGASPYIGATGQPTYGRPPSAPAPTAPQAHSAPPMQPSYEPTPIPTPTAVDFSGVDFGRYHALIIGINDYRELPHLRTAINDARAVEKLLREHYTFRTYLLIDPTRAEVIDALDRLRAALTSHDNLLIYYAGHGYLDEEANQGYWLPVDSHRDRRSNWVSNGTITDTLRSINAKHILVVADSCYSGTLSRDVRIGLRSAEYFQRMVRKKARVAMTSGGLEPVADVGSGGHSPFAKAFLDTLEGNTAVLDGTQLFTMMRPVVMLNAQQTPEYANVRNSGHDGGDFLFVPRGVGGDS